MGKYEKIIELARRRGFFWPSAEIYGGVRGFIDFGPLGCLLKRNIIEKWRKFFVYPHQDFIVEIETPIIMPAKVFEASGHVEHFTDYIVECLKCGRKFRADHLIEEQTGLSGLEKYSERELTEIIRKYGVKCPECGGELSKVRKFNLLFKTVIGPYGGNIGYARPETAQGMFISFKRVYEVVRRKLPLGIAQVGKVLRNEISPRQGPIRLREFTIMEIELFFDPTNPKCSLIEEVKEDVLRILPAERIVKGLKEPMELTVEEYLERKIISNEWLAYFMTVGQRFIESLGIPREKQLFIEKLPEERAHYAAQTFDQTVHVDRWGWIEVAGHAYRTDYDLKRHMKFSGEDLRAFEPYPKPKVYRRKTIRLNYRRIGPKFRGRIKELEELIKNLSGEEIESLIEKIEKEGKVKVGEFILTKEDFTIIVEEHVESGRRFIPHVSEPSYGVERVLYVTLEYAYTEKEGRIVLKLPPDIAPIKVAVFPLLSREPYVSKAKEIYRMIVSENILCLYDDAGSIGKRYARADEIGIPLAITIDAETFEDNTVTLRDRDTWHQVRVPITQLTNIIKDYISLKITFKDLEKKYLRVK